MKSVNTFLLSVIALAIFATCIDPEGEIANPFYDFSESHEHSWGEWEVTKPATCVEAGEKERVCADDKFHVEKRIIPIDPDAHEWEAETEDEDYIPPTCTEAGFGFRSCALCDAETNGRIPALGHEFEVYEVTGAATCTEPGYGFQLCTRCKKNETSISSMPPLGHEFVAYEVTLEPTCTAQGVETARCVRAGNGCAATDEHILDTDPEAHDWEEDYLAPTCIAEGYRLQCCTRCDETKDEETLDIDPDAHDWEGLYVHPTCVLPGQRYENCTLCLTYAIEPVIDALGHEFEEEHHVTNAPTCMAEGVETAYCVRKNSQGCEITEEYPLDIDPSAHEWNDLFVPITAATCTAAGRIRVTCRFNEEHGGEEAVAPLGHDWGSYVTLTPAACTTTGTRRATCSRDNTHQETQTTAALGHSWSASWYFSKSPTCTDTGTEYRECYRDYAHRETRTAAALGHNYGNWATTIAATCSANGQNTRTCTRNSTHKETQTVAALGHSWMNWAQKTAPTCTAAGTDYRQCVRDFSHEDTRTGAAALGHSWGGFVRYSAPTCTAAETLMATCSRDISHRDWKDGAAALGHNYSTEVTKSATCTNAGTTKTTCSRDSSHTYNSVLAALGHDYRYTVTASPTCTATGTRTGTCTRDGVKDTQTLAIDPTAHQWPKTIILGITFGDKWVTVTANTCTTNGERTRTCELNSAHRQTETTLATGHSYSTAWTYSGVTATANGTRYHICLNNSAHTTGTETAYATGTAGLGYSYNYSAGYVMQSFTVSSMGGISGAVHIPAYRLDGDTYYPVKVIYDNGSTNNVTSITFASEAQLEYIERLSCPKLISLAIPASVTRLGWGGVSNAFGSCDSLTSITVAANNPNFSSDGGILYNKAKTEIEYVPPAIIGPVTIPSGVTTIGAGVFSNCTKLTGITLPASLTTIGINSGYSLSSTFANCTSITNITIPASVTFVGYYSFQNWTASQTITVLGKANFQATQNAGWKYTWAGDPCNAKIVYQP